jgi:hypothetical protein
MVRKAREKMSRNFIAVAKIVTGYWLSFKNRECLEIIPA